MGPRHTNAMKAILIVVSTFILLMIGCAIYALCFESHDEQKEEIIARPNDVHNESKMLIRNWLRDVVNLEQYTDNFIQNGYESLAFIQDIGNVDQLSDIGIKKRGHQTRILAQIRRLRNYYMYGHGFLDQVEGDL